jgi:hypothetical protein
VLLATPLIEAWGANVLRGHEGLETWIRRMEGEFAFLDARPLHAEQHDDWVRGHCIVRGRGKASSSEIEFELHHAVRFDGPRIAEFHAFLTPEGASAKTGTHQG